MFLWFCFYLSDFAFTICLGYIFYFLVFCFFFVCFNSYYCHSRKNEEAVTKELDTTQQQQIAITTCGILVSWPEIKPLPLGLNLKPKI